MKKVLMIALEFAPCRSAGVQRSLRFSEYLKAFAWQPYVVTATENIYERRDETLEVLPDVSKHLVQAKCDDAAKKYAVKGRYFQWMTLPDRYWPWYFDAVKQASNIIEKEKPDVIWSTYPVLTAHLIAKKLSIKYNIPWVADFRDPLQCRYDSTAQQYSWIKKWLEKRVIRNASKVVFTSERAASLYQKLYPDQPSDKFVTIENGFYSQDNSLNFKEQSEEPSDTNSKKFQMLYSGSLYANGRDPTPIFSALSSLKKQKIINSDNFILTFRPGKSNAFANILSQFDIKELVEFLPSTSFKLAVEEMKNASATMLIQDEVFHRQIPGKIYDYISVKKPILAITPPNSATNDLVSGVGFAYSAWGEDDIVAKIKQMINNEIDCSEDISTYSRKAKTQQLAKLFQQLIE